MAVTTLADITAALNLIYMDKFEKQFREDCFLPNILPVRPGRNANCVWTPQFDGRSTAGPGTGADVSASDFEQHAKVQASLPWARYYGFASMDGLAQALAAANAQGQIGQTIDVDALREDLEDSNRELARSVSRDCYRGDPDTSPTEISGVDDMADGDAYAGIDKTTSGRSSWEASDLSLDVSDLSLETFRKNLIRPFQDATGYKPDFITCDGATWDLIGSLWGSDIRHVNEIRTYSGQEINLQQVGGYQALSFDGVPIVEDRDATANKCYAWSTKSTMFKQVAATGSSVAQDGLVRAVSALMGDGLAPEAVMRREQRNQRVGARRLQPVATVLANNGDSMRAFLKLYLQLVHRRRNAHAQLTITGL